MRGKDESPRAPPGPPKSPRRRHDGPSTGSGCSEPAKSRKRHDGFTPEKKRRFFRSLRKTGCLRDACRAAVISDKTVLRHRRKWPEFEARVQAALARAATGLEEIAWRRATVGAEEKVWRDGRLVSVRVKPSDAMLRLLLQGAKPKKYGRTGGGRIDAEARRKLEAKLREEIESDVRAERDAFTEEQRSALAEKLVRRIERLRERREREMLDQGYQRVPPDYPENDVMDLVAPGWKLVRDDS